MFKVKYNGLSSTVSSMSLDSYGSCHDEQVRLYAEIMLLMPYGNNFCKISDVKH